jgi:hypothetical protein
LNFVFSIAKTKTSAPDSPNYLPKLLTDFKTVKAGSKTFNLSDKTIGEAKSIGNSGFVPQLSYAWLLSLGNPPGVKKAVTIPDGDGSCTFENIVISGLDQTILDSQDANGGTSGYTSKMILHPPLSADKLTITCDFELTQSVYAVDSGTGNKPFASPHKSYCGGTFTLIVAPVKALVTSDITITGADSNRTLAVNVKSIELSALDDTDSTPSALDGTDSTPVMTLDSLTVTEVDIEGFQFAYEQALGAVLTADYAHIIIFKAVKSALSSSNYTEKASNLAQRYVSNNIFDKYFGAVASGTLPYKGDLSSINPFNVYIFDRARLALTTPGNKLYIPDYIKNSSDPKFDPYSVASYEIDDLNVGSGIKIDKVVLTKISVKGLSAMSVSPDMFVYTAGETVSVCFLADFTMSADIECVISTGNITGDIAVTQKKCRVNMDMKCDSAGNAVVVTVNTIVLNQDTANMSIVLNMTGIFRSVIEQILNTATVKQKLIDGIQKKLSSDDTKKSIGNAVTQKLNQQIQNV